MTVVRWRKDDDGVNRGEEYLELRERRPAEAAALRDAINAILLDLPHSAPPPGPLRCLLPGSRQTGLEMVTSRYA